MAITTNYLTGLKPKAGLYRVNCGEGLLIEVTPTGSKLWRFRYRRNGKDGMLALGKFPKVGLKEARERRDVQIELLEQGKDPADHRRIEAAKASGEHTFEHVATEFLDARAKVTKSAAEDSRSRFVKWVYPYVGTKDVAEVTFSDLKGVLKRIEKANLGETARRVRADLSRVYQYVMANGLTTHDPTPGKAALLDFQTTPYPNPPLPIVRQVLLAIESYEGSAVVKLGLQLLPLLLCRPGELRTLEWKEVLKNEIRLAEGRTKEGRTRIIPLSTQARAILDQLDEITGEGRYVFPSNRDAKRPMSDATLGSALRRLGFESDVIVPHSFRKIASTSLHELGYPSLAIEKQLGHTDSNKIRSVYNAAEFLEQRRTMMQEYSDWLDKLKSSKPE